MQRRFAFYRSARLVIAVALVGWVTVPQGARAEEHAERDSGEAETAERFALALRYYATQQYQDAIDLLKALYVADAEPRVLYALAQAYRMQGDCRRAEEAFRAFLRTGPPRQHARAAKRNLHRCQPQANKAEVAPADVAPPLKTDSHGPPVASTDAPPKLPAPTEHKDSIVSPKPVTSNPRAPHVAVAAMQSLPVVSPPKTIPRWYHDIWGGVLAATALAGGATALGFSIHGAVRRSAARNASKYNRYTEHVRSADRAQTTALIIAGVSSSFFLGAVLRYAWVAR